jgi:uncharacterized NAD-dependent epimerase/dehydratase family protein
VLRPRRLLILAEGTRTTRTTARRPAACCATGPGCRRRPRLDPSARSRKASRSCARSTEALQLGPTAALVGVATSGRTVPAGLARAAEGLHPGGLDVENGLHEFISDDPELSRARPQHGVELRDLRKPPPGLNVPTGANLTHRRDDVLTVGSDCAIGKMTVALELDREARRRGWRSQFVPTGQTGIAIAGWGISVDAVVADFIAGATEQLVLEGVERGGEVSVRRGPGLAPASRRTPASRSG